MAIKHILGRGAPSEVLRTIVVAVAVDVIYLQFDIEPSELARNTYPNLRYAAMKGGAVAA